MNVDFSIIVPLYNEQEVVESLLKRLSCLSSSIELKFQKSCEFVFVNDGSEDGTLQTLMSLLVTIPCHYKIIDLSRNFGHQPAVMAGLSHASGKECIMVIDGDLQDPPELFFSLYEKFTEGFEVVFAVRQSRKESSIQIWFYKTFYKVLHSLSDGMIHKDSGDFALFSRRVSDLLVAFPERQKFIRGLRAMVGFRQTPVYYDRDERKLGKSKYSYSQLIKMAKNGIFSFSDKPLMLIGRVGFIAMALGILYFLIILIKLLTGNPIIEGFPSLVALFIFFTGVQLFCLGLMAEYIARIFVEIKGRPSFIIKDVFTNQTITQNNQ